MNVTITAGEDTPPDELRGLRAWLIREDELRGAVRLLDGAPRAERLGVTADALQIVAGSSSTALAATLIAWIRSRTGRVRIVVKAADGRAVELDSSVVRSMDGDRVSDLTAMLIRSLETGQPPQ
ncbi:hypothetical protein ACIA5C_00255 [Actinoplanes sp. NPDC051343]|uniref:effector-associated constant component EACC1 n=1 Tax=Actinoplanes sp. NPDC051343 TaxID=3363906 RepID=UPI003787B2DD